jgi:flagellar biosynthesis/type III secretory pathway protein FliH
MTVIKDYNLGDEFNELDTSSKKVSRIIKSDQLVSNDNTVIPGVSVVEEVPVYTSELEEKADTDTDDDDDVLQEVKKAAPSAVDISKMREDIYQEIKQDNQQALKEQMDSLMDAIQGLSQSRDEIIDSVKTDLVDLSLQIAEKVILTQVDQDTTVIKAVIEDTFNKIAGSDRVTFKVHPDDIPMLTEYKPYIESRLIGVQKITIQPDAQVGRGGAIIETDLGFVDVTVKEKLNVIKQTFEQIKSTL